MPLIKSKYQWNLLTDQVIKDDKVFEVINLNRDIHDHEAFFSMGQESIHSPYLMKDMDKAVNRIKLAIEQNERILIFGDYDCDGITSVAILYRVLNQMKANVAYQIPDRFSDGYGLNLDIVHAWINQYDLIVTVDNGISSIREIDYIQDRGIDVIVTDHHQFKETLPKAYAILHTMLSPDYPFKDIAGCMVAFKLAWALKNEFPLWLTDLAMIGTIADLMPLEDENQAMVNLGLEQIKKTKHIGLDKIVTHSDLTYINQTAIAFQIAPKINSSGRLNQANLAIQLLTTDNVREANELILAIEENHEVRKKHTETSFKIAESMIDANQQIIVVASPDFHEGVIGICAQRLAEKYQKPTIVLYIENDVAKGSARSFGQVSILKVLQSTEDLLERFGGHHQAAGLQLKTSDLNQFIEVINAIDIDETDPVIDIDMEVDINQISKKTIALLQEKAFHTALFLVKELTVVSKQIIGKNHVKLVLEKDYKTYEAIKFNQVNYYYNLNVNDVIDICCGLTINQFRNKETIQMMISDLRCNHFQVLDYRNTLNIKMVKENLFDDFKLINDHSILLSEDLKELMLEGQSFALLPKEETINYNLMMDRNELAKVYSKLKTLAKFDKFDIMNIFNVSKLQSNLIIAIFEDLNLVTSSDQFYQFVQNKKKNLTESKTYQLLVDKKRTIDWLYTSPVDKIVKYMEAKNGL